MWCLHSLTKLLWWICVITLTVDMDVYSPAIVSKNVTCETMDYLRNASFPFISDISKYLKEAKIGQGTFGEVYKARDITKNKVVALKKILTEHVEKEGFPITALREIKILQLLQNENVVKLIEICRSQPDPKKNFQSTFFLVFEFCDYDMVDLITNRHVQLSMPEVKNLLKQLLNGLYYIHQNRIMHRDLKPANVLLTKEGKLKLADFGLARAFSPGNRRKQEFTTNVVTLWYRPPEILLGKVDYSTSADIWAIGCIMGELFTRVPIFRGTSQQNQLYLISNLCGTICPQVWPEVAHLDLFKTLRLPPMRRRINEKLGPFIKDINGLNLLNRLLAINPSERPDAGAALDHDFFFDNPLPSDDIKHLMSRHTQTKSPPFNGADLMQITVAPAQPRPTYQETQFVDRVF